MEALKDIFNFTLFSVKTYEFRLYNLILFILTIIMVRFLVKFFRVFVFKTIKKRDWIDEEKAKTITRIGRLTILLFGFFLAVRSLSLGALFTKFLNYELISGDNPIIVRSVLISLFILLISIMLIRLTVVLLKVSIRNHGTIDRGREFSIIRLYKYFAYLIAIIIAMQLAGINLRGLFIGSAALLVGIGFAIQNLFNDFFSGLILLFEDSFDVGDIIFMEGEVVKVKQINLRTSTMLKRDGNSLTIPNRLLTDNKIDNWSQDSPYTRFDIKVSVAYGSDLELVKKILHSTASNQSEISKNHPIKIFFDDFGDSGLNFSLIFWMKTTWDFREILSKMRFSIDKQFRENDVEIPFPQRDIHFRNSLPSL